ncbi:hypothetical protein CZ787_01380 [Halomonas citrativorans]|uniref:Uncharacterized protein n=1 Tax=Halomonas citrativorans TaxID=2742612 RepID=A0A1R4HPC4_9GAMM|nr:hypothetical protein CZ787_01380 [Halomonas citrativorans]
MSWLPLVRMQWYDVAVSAHRLFKGGTFSAFNSRSANAVQRI